MTVPAAIVHRLSRAERIGAQVCARRFGIKWRIVDAHG